MTWQAYLIDAAGFFLQFYPCALLVFMPFGEDKLAVGRRRIYLALTLMLLATGALFPLAIIPAPDDATPIFSAFGDGYALATMAAIAAAYLRLVRENVYKKLLVVYVVIYYAALTYWLSNFIHSFLPDPWALEVSTTYCSMLDILYMIFLFTAFPAAAMFMRRVVAAFLREIEPEQVKREFRYATLSTAAFLALMILLDLAAAYRGNAPVYFFLMLDQAMIYYLIFTGAVTRTREENARRTLDVLRERRRLTEENYRQMEQRLRDTSLMRHEWKNQVAALRLMAEQGSYEELVRTLERMDSRLTRLSTARYSDNFTVNVILQNAASRATELGVVFTAYAPLPEKLGIDESDLCSLLINLLENALDAASKATDRREIRVSLKVYQELLLVKCWNTYSGPLPRGEDGAFLSTKPSPEEHGWGIRQMRWVAEKYNAVLDITYTDSRVTIQTALSMKK